MKSPLRGRTPTLTRILAGTLMLTVALGLTPAMHSMHSPARAEAEILPTEDTPTQPVAHEVQLALVVPLSVPPAETGTLDADQLGEYIAEEGLLGQLLSLANSHGLSLAIDPYLIHSLVTAETPAADNFLQQLRLAPTDKFLMSYANTPVAYLDEFPQAQAAQSGNLEQLELLGIEHPLLEALDQSFWSPNDLVNPELLQELPDAVRRVFMPTAQLPDAPSESEELSDRYRAVENTNGLTAYFAHSEASAAFNEAVDNPSQVIYNNFIRLIRFELPESQSELVIVPAIHERLPEFLEQLTTQFNVHLVSLSALTRHHVTALSSKTQFDDLGRDPDLVNDITSVIRSNTRATAFLTALNVPDIATAQYQLFALQSLSHNYSGTERADAQVSYTSAVTELEHSITLEPGSDITLITPESQFGVSVNNALVSPAQVVIRFHASNNRVAIPDQMIIEVDGHSKQTVTVPISAYGNGQVTLSMTLYTKNGVQLGATQQLQVQIQAQLELVVMIVFFVLVAGFLTAGIVRSVRKRASNQSEATSTIASASEPDKSELR